MKEIWLSTTQLVGKYNLPKSKQGIRYRAQLEGWKKRTVLGKLEFEVSQVINRQGELLTLEDPNQLPNKLYFDKTNHVNIPTLTTNVFMPSDGDIINKNDVGNLVISKQWLAKNGLTDAKLMLFEMVGDSMAPTIQDSDLVLARVLKEWLDPIDGVFVIRYGSHLLIKRLQYDLVNHGWHVLNDNALYPPMFIKSTDQTTIKIIAKVERVMSKIRNID